MQWKKAIAPLLRLTKMRLLCQLSNSINWQFSHPDMKKIVTIEGNSYEL
ncbi:MAG TPA: hypothetical protein IGS40_20845 [Trichormus sp. M33_DOE_039]|nr:hypothetical protein [Trichormus sp. M33_DOE_039]